MKTMKDVFKALEFLKNDTGTVHALMVYGDSSGSVGYGTQAHQEWSFYKLDEEEIIRWCMNPNREYDDVEPDRFLTVCQCGNSLGCSKNHIDE